MKKTFCDIFSFIRKAAAISFADLVYISGCPRDLVYKWINGESEPNPEQFVRIQILYIVVDSFAREKIRRPLALLKTKAFDGRSLLDIIAAGEPVSLRHIDFLISFAKDIEAAYDRSGLAKSKAKPTNDWLSEISIPGYLK